MVRMALTARVTASPLASASLADWRAIFSVWAALSAFCLMLAAICFHRGRGLFGRGRLFGRALRHLLGARRQFLAARRDVLRRRRGHRRQRRAGVRPSAPAPGPACPCRTAASARPSGRRWRSCRDIGGGAKVCDHALHCKPNTSLSESGLTRWRDRPRRCGRQVRCVAQVGRHDVDGIDQVLDLVVGLDLDLVIEIADAPLPRRVRRSCFRPRLMLRAIQMAATTENTTEADGQPIRMALELAYSAVGRAVGGMQILDNYPHSDPSRRLQNGHR